MLANAANRYENQNMGNKLAAVPRVCKRVGDTDGQHRMTAIIVQVLQLNMILLVVLALFHNKSRSFQGQSVRCVSSMFPMAFMII